MADIEEAVVEFLSSDAAYRALADDGNNGVRLYPDNAPEKSGYPRTIYSLAGTTEDETLGGNANQPVVQLTLEHHDQGTDGAAGVKALAAAARNATGGVTGGQPLKLFNGLMGVVSQVFVQQCRLTAEASLPPEQGVGGDRKWVHAITQTFSIGYIRQTGE